MKNDNNNSKKSKVAPTIYDVAKRAGVSVSTVSRVMNNDPLVSDATIKNVESAIRILNYKRVRAANTKITGMKLIALVLPDILNPFYAILIKGIEDIAKIQGYNIILCDYGFDSESENALIMTLLENKIKGIIYIPSSVDNSLIDKLIEEDFSLVFLDRKIEKAGICYVTSANEEGAYQAVRYLLKLGHREIVFIAGSQQLSTSTARFNGYKKALSENRITINENLVLHGDFNLDKTYNEVSRFIKKGISFTAIFAASDIMAFGAKKALEENNLKIPDEVSLVGYDDVPFSTVISLTTVSQPGYEIGRSAMLLLIDLINKRVKPPQQIVLRPSLILRESCKKR
ncbi:MAG: LacI family DNA-binding transcriptional regulator [Spirochaetota bacterium]